MWGRTSAGPRLRPYQGRRRAVGGDRATVARGRASDPAPGTQAAPGRLVFQGALFVMHTGIAWEHLRQELGFGSGMPCWRRLAEWTEAAMRPRLHEVLLAKLRTRRPWTSHGRPSTNPRSGRLRTFRSACGNPCRTDLCRGAADEAKARLRRVMLEHRRTGATGMEVCIAGSSRLRRVRRSWRGLRAFLSRLATAVWRPLRRAEQVRER